MRLILFSCLTAGVLSGGLIAAAEAAMPTAPLSAGDVQLVRRVTNVCGANGCVRVQTQRVQHQKPGGVAAKRI
jgi:hypothetical protein